MTTDYFMQPLLPDKKENGPLLWITIIGILFALWMGCFTPVKAQTPKQHVFYDTVKTVKERIDFSPDTIPVYFKELIIDKPNDTTPHWTTDSGIMEHWVKGFVIWHTYEKPQYGLTDSWYSSGRIISGTSGNFTYIGQPSSYIKNEYPSITMQETAQFLYGDHKTKVTNKVIFSIKR